jgi:hypothetical protein
MARTRGEPAELARPQDARHGASGNLNVKLVLDLDFQISAAPTYHTIPDGVRLGLKDPVQLRKTALVKQRFAARARAKIYIV